MAITALTDPNSLPNQSQSQDVFDTNMGAMIANLPLRAQQENELAATMSRIAAGGGFTIPYTFSSSTTNADPGAGQLRLNSATQNAATAFYIDLLGADGATYTGMLDRMDDSSSIVKGQISLVSLNDPSKWLAFELTALASPSGYKTLTVANAGSSAANPFANGEDLIMSFTRTGDKGDIASNTAFTPVAVAALDINCASGNYFSKTISGASTFTFSNVPAGGFSFTLEVQMDSGSIALPASVKLANDFMPTLAAGKTHLLMFVTKNGGARWRLTVAPNFVN